MSHDDTLRTHADLAEVLNLPLSTTVELRKREGWPHVRIGRHVRFTAEQIEQIKTTHTVVGGEAEAAPVFEDQRPSRRRRAS